jgi:hypothetical protein
MRAILSAEVTNGGVPYSLVRLHDVVLDELTTDTILLYNEF